MVPYAAVGVSANAQTRDSPLLRMMPLWPDAGSAIVISLMVPFSCIPTGSLNVTNICRPINWLAMVTRGSRVFGSVSTGWQKLPEFIVRIDHLESAVKQRDW